MTPIRASLIRSIALIRKETRQMLRDRSTLTLGVVLPLALLLLFGFGLSLDVTRVPVAVVMDSASPATRELFFQLRLSPYFEPVITHSWAKAESALRQGDTQAIVRLADNRGKPGEAVQIVVNGRDSNQARIMLRYVAGAVQLWAAQNAAGDSAGSALMGQAVAETRIWYNPAMESRFFLVPGVIALIMTLIGALLTALVIAREWERGTWEALLATPVRMGELLAGKTVPYFLLGMIGLALCLAAARWIFEVPLRGSAALVVGGSALYLLVCLELGLLISAAVKNQFLASQIVLLVSFLPTLMLSGFIFDLRAAPKAVYVLGHLFPATWYVELLQTLFLVGNIPEILVRDLAVLGCFALGLMMPLRANLGKTLE